MPSPVLAAMSWFTRLLLRKLMCSAGTFDAIHSAAIEDQENLPGIIVVGAVTALAAIIAAQEREQTSARTSALLG